MTTRNVFSARRAEILVAPRDINGAAAHRPSVGDWLYRQLLLERAWTRRSILGGIGGVALAACSSGGGSDSTSATGTGATTGTTTGTTTGSTTGTTGSSSLSCVLIPEETVGPYPLFNDIASAATYQREDITEGKTGMPLNLILNIVNVNNACAPVTTAMVYIWHCDKDGYYSGYNNSGQDLRGQTFLRGVQATDTNGQAKFATIFPGWYQGRATHIHFRVYLALDLQATSQLAFPDNVTAAVYNTPLYSARGQNTTTALRDGIFSDGVTYQLPAMTQSATTGGYDAVLTVGIDS